ncbi:MAG TPA: magnesium chelatase domain-containing protein, partial [Defluviitaleaceae bacterium]|nr:magnesium chelatase domain-containing protein [Defluviitaleaceae bacterium]
VYGIRMGALLEIEVTAQKAEEKSKGTLTVTGIIEEEEFNKNNGKMKRTSTAKGSVENVLTVMKSLLNIPYKDYDIHINFPGGIPIDGPSAGIAIFIAVYSAIFNKPISNKIAMTGEISIRGNIHPVGGVHAKINAAKEAGIEKVFIPLDNWQETFESYGIEVIAVKNIEEVIEQVFEKTKDDIVVKTKTGDVLTAQGM